LEHGVYNENQLEKTPLLCCPSGNVSITTCTRSRCVVETSFQHERKLENKNKLNVRDVKEKDVLNIFQCKSLPSN